MTAIEWLVNYLTNIKELPFIRQDLNKYEQNILNDIIEKAKQMEKEEIMRTAWHCHIEGVKQCSKTSQEYIQYAEQYYNETFKNQ
jgi:hypothetical protein